MDLKELQCIIQTTLLDKKNFEQIHQELKQWVLKLEPMFKQSCYVGLLEYDVHPLMIAAVTGKRDIFKWCLNHFIEDSIIDKVIINLEIGGRHGAMETDRLCMLKTLNEKAKYSSSSNTNNFNLSQSSESNLNNSQKQYILIGNNNTNY